MPISPHLVCAHLKGAIPNLKFKVVYAPAPDAEGEAKGSFHDDVQNAVGRVPAGDMLIVTGYWNA